MNGRVDPAFSREMESMYLAPRVSLAHVNRRIDEARGRIEDACRGRRGAVAWSGGKDALALWVVVAPTGHTDGVIVLNDLELPSFERYLEVHRPASIQVVRRPQTLDWLAARPEWLFPEDREHIRRWARMKQIAGQEAYCRTQNIEILLTGRRRADGNFIPRDRELYRKRGTLVSSPLGDWTHAETLACLRYYDVPLPSSYHRPFGWVVGSKHWALYRASQLGEHPWSHLARYEPDLIPRVVGHFPDAARSTQEERKCPCPKP